MEADILTREGHRGVVVRRHGLVVDEFDWFGWDLVGQVVEVSCWIQINWLWGYLVEFGVVELSQFYLASLYVFEFGIGLLTEIV